MVDQPATFGDPLATAGGPSEGDYPTLAVAFHVDPSAIGVRRVLIGSSLVLGRRSEASGPSRLRKWVLEVPPLREETQIDPKSLGY